MEMRSLTPFWDTAKNFFSPRRKDPAPPAQSDSQPRLPEGRRILRCDSGWGAFPGNPLWAYAS
jgi:hypothetical protein